MVLESSFEKVSSVVHQQVGGQTMQEKTSNMGLEDCLEEVVEWVATRRGKEYFVEPLDTFLAQWGKAFPEDPFYQDRMNYFLEYCVLERTMTGNLDSLTPFMAFIKESSGLQLLKNKCWQSFCDFRHSVFEVLKSGDDQILIRDLLSLRSYKVVPKEQETLKFMAKKSIFQGFIFSSDEGYRLGQGIIIHPEKSRKQILKFMREQKKVPRFTENEILKMIAFTNMRFLRMQHVNPSVIYARIFA